MGVTAIILAGGKSSRFGRDKSLLQLNRKPLMQHLTEQCAAFADEILIISNQENKFGLPGIRELQDHYRDMGPLGGIHAGLCAASNPHIFVTACDMPFFHAGLAQRMLASLNVYEAVLPCHHTYFEPLFSAMRKDRALAEAESLLANGDRKVLLLFDRLHTHCRECDGEELNVFYNINYPEDYVRLASGCLQRNTALLTG